VKGSPLSLMVLVAPLSVRLLLRVSVPAVKEVPGAICEPEAAETLPLTEPEPARVLPLPRFKPPTRLASRTALVATEMTEELAMEPLGARRTLPALINVGPE